MGRESLQNLREQIKDWVRVNGPSGIFGSIPDRSCWKCNPAHEWMKTDMDTPYRCFNCGHVYFKGIQITED